MHRRIRNSAVLSSNAASSATDTEWSDAEERATHRALIFKRKIDDGAAACARGDFTSALGLYEEAIRLDPSNHVLYTNRSAIFCKLGQYEDALADAEKSFALNPGWIKAFYRKGYALKSMGRFIAALSAYATGLAQDSKNWQLLCALIECMSQSDMKDRFSMVYNELKYLGLEKSPFVIVSVVGQEVLNSGQVTDAINILECALKIGTTSMKLRQSVLSALSTAYYNVGDWVKAKQFMKEDLSIAVSLGDFFGEARTQGNLGMLCMASGKLSDALNHYYRQLKLFSQLNAKPQLCTTLSTIGQLHRRLFDYDKALLHHERCLETLQEITNFDDESTVLLLCQQYGYIGDVRLALGQYDEAEKYFMEHLEFARCHEFRSEEIKALSELGTVDQACGRWEDALNRYTAAMKLSKDEKNRQAEASLCCNLCIIYETKGRLETARRWADRALALALSLRDQYLEAKTCGHLAAIELKMGALENAKKLFRRQLDMATKLGDIALMMKSYRGLGVAYSSGDVNGGCLTDAVRCHKTELSLARDLGDKFSEAAAHGHLGTVYTKLNDHQTAGTHFLHQLALAKETKNAKLEMTSMKNLGFHYSNGESAKLDSAMEYFEKFLMLAQENNDLEAEHMACTNLGKTHFRLGHYKESARYYGQALTLAKDLRDHRATAKAYCELGKIRTAMNEFEEALECQKYFLALAHILNDVESKLLALFNIGDILIKSGKSNVATKVFAKQLSLAKLSKRKKFEAAAYGQLGKAYDMMGKREKALGFFVQELTLYEELRDFDGQYEAQGHICEHYECERQISLALKALEKQAQLAKNLNQREKEADVYKRLGELCSKWNMLDDAIRYFGERRRLLALIFSNNSIENNQIENHATTKRRASLDYARCLASAGDDIGAVGAFEEILESIDTADQSKIDTSDQIFGKSEIGLIYRDQGWCWYRLGNYEKAYESFESALVYLEKSVVDASVKCDCYRVLAAIDTLLNRSESAQARLNRLLEFVRSVELVLEEPKILCDLAYVTMRNGDSGRAEELLRNSMVLISKNTDFENWRLEFRALSLLALIKGDCWKEVIDFAMNKGDHELIIKALILNGAVLISSSPSDAEQRFFDASARMDSRIDTKLVVLMKTLSALRFWTIRDIQASRDEFLSAVGLVESMDGAWKSDVAIEQGLFDEEFPKCCVDICLTLSFLFFASQKMDEDALVIAEKIRLYHLEQLLRKLAIRNLIFDNGCYTYEARCSQLRKSLDNLTNVALYFMQVEDFLFSWILTSGFRMSSSYRIEMNSTKTSYSPTIFAPLRLQFPLFLYLSDHIRKLILRDSFNDLSPPVVQLSTIIDQSFETSLAHDGRPPVIVGCDSIMECIFETISTPTCRLTFLPFESPKVAGCQSENFIILDASGKDLVDIGIKNVEFIDPGTSKSILLSKFKQCNYLYIKARYSCDDDALILDSNNINDEKLFITDILNNPITASLVIIDLDMSDRRKSVSNMAVAFLLSGCSSVIMTSNLSKQCFNRFYKLLQDGQSPRDALDQCNRDVDQMERPDFIYFCREFGENKTQILDEAAVALRMLLQTPEECREALRVILHLIEKALQRIGANSSNPMFTSERSVKNKAGPEVRGCIEYLLALGFKRGDVKDERLSSNDALYFPIKDDGSLANGSCVIQALLGLPQTALFAFSKLVSNSDNGSYNDVLNLIENLERDLTLSTSVQLETTVPRYVWSIAGVPELLAALGLDKMRESSNGVTVKTIRMELTRKKVKAAIISLKALRQDSTAKRYNTHPGTQPIYTSKIANEYHCAKTPVSSKFSYQHETTADLSGVESDVSTMDPSLKSVVSLMKRCGNGSARTGHGISTRRGKRNVGKRGRTGGYVSEGDEMKNKKVEPQLSHRSRGYCSEDDDRRGADDSGVFGTAQVISVDERASPMISDDDEYNRFPEENIVVVTNDKKYLNQHEYARLETPTPFSTINSRYGGSISPSGYALPKTTIQDRAKPQPPPYSAVRRTMFNESYQDIYGPMAMRKAMEKLSLGQTAPTYGSVSHRLPQNFSLAEMKPQSSPDRPPPQHFIPANVMSQNSPPLRMQMQTPCPTRMPSQNSPPARMPPPYGMHRRQYGTNGLAGY